MNLIDVFVGGVVALAIGAFLLQIAAGIAHERQGRETLAEIEACEAQREQIEAAIEREVAA